MDRLIETPQQLGELIRAVRKAQGIRQDDLAGLISASHVFVLEVERGKPTAQIGKVLDLLRELGIRLKADVPDSALPPASPPATSTSRKRRNG